MTTDVSNQHFFTVKNPQGAHIQLYSGVTHLKSKNKLYWGSSGNDAVTGVVHKQKIQDSQQTHESWKEIRHRY